MSGVYEERLFSENLDRLLAGEEIQFEAGVDNDLRTALDFAGKMKSLQAAPSPQFKSNLKARLLQKLDEQEDREEAGGWLARLIRQPVWQAVAVLVLMIVVGGGIMWRTGLFNTSGPGMTSQPPVVAPLTTTAAPTMTVVPSTTAPFINAAPTTTSPAAGSSIPAATYADNTNRYLTASASTDKFAYQSGELVNIRMELQNATSGNLTIDEYPPILSVMNKSTGQPLYTFQAGMSSRTLAPGEKVDYIETWNQRDAKGNAVEPGTYYLELEDLYYQGKSVQMQLSSPVSFIIY
jgi:hypothetical protein